MEKWNKGFVSFPFLVVLVAIISLSETILFFSKSNMELLTLTNELNKIGQIETLATLKLKKHLKEFCESQAEFLVEADDEKEEVEEYEIAIPFDTNEITFYEYKAYVDIDGVIVEFELSEDYLWIINYSITK